MIIYNIIKQDVFEYTLIQCPLFKTDNNIVILLLNWYYYVTATEVLQQNNTNS